MRALFRVDSSCEMGAGHLMRCLTLADALAVQGHASLFVMRQHEGHLAGLVERKGHALTLLPCSLPTVGQGGQSSYRRWLGAEMDDDAWDARSCAQSWRPDWIIVDHYGVDAHWSGQVQRPGSRLLVIDDLANRAHQCDVLLDQTLGRTARDYAPWVPASARVLAGAEYSLLRPEFAELRAASLARRPAWRISHLLISFGGVDGGNVTCRALAALRRASLPEDCRITVVLGPTNPWQHEVADEALRMPWETEVKVGVENMGELLLSADLVLGAAGSSAWERCCLGVPSIMVVLAENQREVAHALSRAGAAVVIDHVDHLAQELPARIDALSESAVLEQISAAASDVADGQGVQRVVEVLTGEAK